MFYLLYLFLWLIMWLPLPLLYPLTDFVYLILYYLVGYRKKLVRRNLRNSFPEKSEQERRQIERRFYRSFVDSMMESMYSIHMSKNEIRKRFTYSSIDLIEKVLQNHPGCFVMASHYGNWEWATGAKLSMDKKINYFTIYRALKNKHFDKMMMDVRTRRGNINVEKKDLLNVLKENTQNHVVGFYGMISDQKPSLRTKDHWYWTNFLHQDTPFLTGTEFLAKRYNYAVLYAQIKKVKRGYYHCTLQMITENPRDTADGEITEKYARLLEQDIINAPEYWLWSHDRWRHKKEAL